MNGRRGINKMKSNDEGRILNSTAAARSHRHPSYAKNVCQNVIKRDITSPCDGCLVISHSTALRSLKQNRTHLLPQPCPWIAFNGTFIYSFYRVVDLWKALISPLISCDPNLIVLSSYSDCNFFISRSCEASHNWFALIVTVWLISLKLIKSIPLIGSIVCNCDHVAQKNQFISIAFHKSRGPSANCV